MRCVELLRLRDKGNTTPTGRREQTVTLPANSAAGEQEVGQHRKVGRKQWGGGAVNLLKGSGFS